MPPEAPSPRVTETDRDLYLRELLDAAPAFTDDQVRDIHAIAHAPIVTSGDARESA